MGMKQMDIILKYGISEGTLRTADLLESFMDAIKDLNSVEYEGLIEAAKSRGARDMAGDGGVDWETWVGSHGHAATVFLWKVVTQVLDRLAPDGYYFGAPPGNGSLYGFWKDEDTEKEEVE